MKKLTTKKGEEILVDDEDYQDLKPFAWHLTGDKDLGTMRIRRSYKRNGKTYNEAMARRILSPQLAANPKLQVRHRNGDKFDLRKDNLVLITCSERAKQTTWQET